MQGNVSTDNNKEKISFLFSCYSWCQSLSVQRNELHLRWFSFGPAASTPFYQQQAISFKCANDAFQHLAQLFIGATCNGNDFGNVDGLQVIRVAFIGNY